MSNKTRFILGVVFSAAIAALAVPEFSQQIPYHVGAAVAAALSMALHRINAKSDEDAQ
jgi:hypothetical protein